MSTEEQDAIVGRLVRQRAEASKHLALIGAELDVASSALKTLGECLRMRDFKYPGTKSAEEIIETINLERITKLLAESRETTSRRDQAIAKLEELGIKS